MQEEPPKTIQITIEDFIKKYGDKLPDEMYEAALMGGVFIKNDQSGKGNGS